MTQNIFYSSNESKKDVLENIVNTHLDYKVFVLTDENTHQYCLPYLLQICQSLSDAEILIIPSGELSKNIATAEHLWHELMRRDANKKSLLICLGGGTITDMGGFVAATFKRGIDCIYIPTTLLGMVDAAIGGKTAININEIKNQIGLYSQSKGVFLFPEFLKTLPSRQLLSGFGEVIKHAMLDSDKHFEQCMMMTFPEDLMKESNILYSSQVKINIVNKDPFENNIRKALNFGHTIGHAIESISLNTNGMQILHGEAVALGLICETYISFRMMGYPQNNLEKLIKLIKTNFSLHTIDKNSMDSIVKYMCFDKKNLGNNKYNFTLLKGNGNIQIDQYPKIELIKESIEYMNKVMS